MLKKLAIMLNMLWMATVLSGQEPEAPDIDAVNVKNPKTAAVLSAVFPGAGQIYNGKWMKATLLLGFEAVTVYEACYYHQKFKDNPASDEDQISRNKFIWYTAGGYLYAMLDAVVDAHLSSFPDRSLTVDPLNGHYELCLSLEF